MYYWQGLCLRASLASMEMQEEQVHGMYFPWFMQETSGFAAYKIGIAVLILLMIGMAFIELLFLSFLLSWWEQFFLCFLILPFFSLERKRESCIKGCSKCTRSCPAKIELREAKTSIVQGECFQCQKCIDGCPKGKCNLWCWHIKRKWNWIYCI